MALGRAVGPSFYEDRMMGERNDPQRDALAERLGHVFASPVLLEQALVHPSLSGKSGNKKSAISPYERLEFLGDRVLGLVIAHWLYELYPDAKEGELAKRHAALVNRDALREIAREIGLEDALRLVHGEASARQNLAALSDAMEAVIGALYLDGGLGVAEAFIKSRWDVSIHEEKAPADPKTALQEWAQGKGLPLPLYKTIARSGPAHAPRFEIELTIKGCEKVTAVGGSKREAEKDAARLMLAEIAKR